VLVGEGHPAADLHLVGGRRGGTTCALQALVEIAQIPFKIGQTLLVGLFALGRLFGVQGCSSATLACNCASPCGVT
jgi:hypothetical protein